MNLWALRMNLLTNKRETKAKERSSTVKMCTNNVVGLGILFCHARIVRYTRLRTRIFFVTNKFTCKHEINAVVEHQAMMKKRRNRQVRKEKDRCKYKT